MRIAVAARRSIFVLAVGAGALLAADRPIGGDHLLLKDPVRKLGSRTVKFEASRDPAIDAASGADPRQVGATLQVMGANPGDGTSGLVALDASHWKGLGKPAGSKGYKFADRTRPGGIRTVTLRSRAKGGTLSISGGGSDWSYAIVQPQGSIDLRFTVGGDVYCAHFATFAQNRPGKVKAKLAPAPAGCGGSAPTGCGDGVAADAEECDDGNTSSGDGCSASCQLESTSALCAGVPTISGTGLDTVRVAAGLDRPVYVTAPPLDPARIFIVEQNGVVRIVKNGTLLPTPFLDIRSDVTCCGEQGLLSIAFTPGYESSGVFYVSFTNTAGKPEVRRFTVSADPDVADPSGTLILDVEDFAPNHNGGLLLFGPDGYLYYGMGDGGGSDDPQETGQDLTRLLGKIMRLDVNAPTYTVPVTNPFVGTPGARPEIWAYGLRNPWRFSFDRATGDLYIADVGQGAREEVDVQPAASTGGENYGWDVFEGFSCHEPEPPATMCPSPPTGLTFPVLEYDHSQGCSITGGFVYRGCGMPDLRGTYFYSDICAGFVRTFKGVSGGTAQNRDDRTTDVAPGSGLSIGGVSSFGEDARGELYIVDYGNGDDGQGEVYKLVPGS